MKPAMSNCWSKSQSVSQEVIKHFLKKQHFSEIAYDVRFFKDEKLTEPNIKGKTLLSKKAPKCAKIRIFSSLLKI